MKIAKHEFIGLIKRLFVDFPQSDVEEAIKEYEAKWYGDKDEIETTIETFYQWCIEMNIFITQSKYIPCAYCGYTAIPDKFGRVIKKEEYRKKEVCFNEEINDYEWQEKTFRKLYYNCPECGETFYVEFEI